MAIRKLLTGHLTRHKARAALTMLAAALAVSLVITLTGAFASLQSAAERVLGGFYGEVDLIVEPTDRRGALLGAGFMERLRADERVAEVRGRLEVESPLLDEDGERVRGRPIRLVGRPPREEAGLMDRTAMRAGDWFREDGGNVAVIEEGVAQRLEVGVGDTIRVPSPEGPIRLEVLGIVGKPDVLQMEAPAVFVPLQTLQAWRGQEGELSRVEVRLEAGVDAEAFAEELRRRHRGVEGDTAGASPTDAAQADGAEAEDAAGSGDGEQAEGAEASEDGEAAPRVHTARSQREVIERNMQGLHIFSYLGGGLSIIAAVFIVFSAVSMGVSERTRTLAMLRAIGAERGQIIRLVLVEGLVLAAVGAVLGVGLGWVWLKLLVALYPELFSAGAVVTAGGVLCGTGGTVAAAVVASALPASSAARAGALDAMTAATERGRASLPVWCVLGGLALVGIDTAVAFTPGIDRTVRLVLHLYVGLPCLVLGLFGLAPLLVIGVDRLLARPVARLFGVEPSLLRQQLAGGLWRSVGTVSALMVGVVALVGMQTHGRSMIEGWRLPDEFPDMLLFSPFGLESEAIEKLEGMDAFQEGSLLPVAMVSPELGRNIFGLGGVAQMPEATIVFGLDVGRAFEAAGPGGDRLVRLDFIEGDHDTALRRLKKGRHIIVSEEFHEARGLGVGDTLTLKTPVNGEVEYTIAGVVRAMGIDMVVRVFELEREFQQWTAAAAVTMLEDVKRDFGVERIHMFAANLATDRPKAEVREAIRTELDSWGVLTADARRIKGAIESGLRRLLNLMSVVALAAIGVASLGVANTVVASVRSRRWQFGVLRSLGLGRAGLMRLVLAEAALIGLVAVALGVGGGLMLGINANRMALEVLGYRAGLVLPYSAVGLGAALTLGVCNLAGLWPALRVARTETLTLLQAGRAAD